MRQLWKKLLTLVILIAIMQPCRAVPVPSFNLTELVNNSDFIAVGYITEVREIERTTMTLRGFEQDARIMAAQVRVDRILKGSAPQGVVTVRFVLALRYEIGYRALSKSSYRTIFLKKPQGGASDFDLTSPYYPSAPAVPDSVIPGATAQDAVIAEIANVIASSSTPWEARREAIFDLQFQSGDVITKALKVALADSDPRVSDLAAASLLLHNDISGMPLAERLLLGNTTVALRQDDRSNLLAGVTYGIHDALALNSLTRLLASPDPEVRKAAASGLGNTGSSLAQASLLKALDDPDSHVRFSASNGLANLTGDATWRQLNFNEFAKAEQQYVQHWKSLAE